MDDIATLIRQRSESPQNAKQPRRLLARALVAEALAGRGDTYAAAIVEERYRGAAEIRAATDLLTRSAVAPHSTSSVAGLVQSILVEWELALAPVSALEQLRQLGGRAFTAEPGTRLNVPVRAPLGGASGTGWIAENGVIPVVAIGLASGALQPHKAAGIVAFTNELDLATNNQAEKILIELLSEDLAALLDAALGDALPASDRRPAGLLNGITPVASVDRDTDLGVIYAGLSAMKARVPAIVAHPARLAGLWSDPGFAPLLAQDKLGPAALVTSYFWPAGTLVGIDAAAFASVMSVPEIRASKSAALTMASADAVAPTQSVKADGTLDVPGEVGSGLGIHVSGQPTGAATAGVFGQSMLQSNATALRLIQGVSWALVRTGSVVAVTGAAW